MEIQLSPKFGLNPTIPVCFWCGSDKNEIAVLGRIGNEIRGEDFEAPKHMVLDYEPCDNCRENMSKGFTVMEATNRPNSVTNMEIQSGVYPTGRFVVLRIEAAKRMFNPEILTIGKAFIDVKLFDQLFGMDV